MGVARSEEQIQPNRGFSAIPPHRNTSSSFNNRPDLKEIVNLTQPPKP
jgi:hypothetical protein